MRINITISDEMNEKLNAISKKWGVSKSNLCTIAIGQYVEGLDRAYEIVGNLEKRLMDTEGGKIDEIMAQMNIEEILGKSE